MGEGMEFNLNCFIHRERMAFFTRLGHAVPEVPHGGEYDGAMVADLPVLGSVCAAGKMTTHVHPHVTVAMNPRNYPLVRQGPTPHYPINYSSIDEEDDQAVAAGRVVDGGGVRRQFECNIEFIGEGRREEQVRALDAERGVVEAKTKENVDDD